MAAIINAMIVSIATIPSSNGAMVDGRWFDFIDFEIFICEIQTGEIDSTTSICHC